MEIRLGFKAVTFRFSTLNFENSRIAQPEFRDQSIRGIGRENRSIRVVHGRKKLIVVKTVRSSKPTLGMQKASRTLKIWARGTFRSFFIPLKSYVTDRKMYHKNTRQICPFVNVYIIIIFPIKTYCTLRLSNKFPSHCHGPHNGKSVSNRVCNVIKLYSVFALWVISDFSKTYYHRNTHCYSYCTIPITFVRFVTWKIHDIVKTVKTSKRHTCLKNWWLLLHVVYV